MLERSWTASLFRLRESILGQYLGILGYGNHALVGKVLYKGRVLARK